jgi:hypothetical protein
VLLHQTEYQYPVNLVSKYAKPQSAEQPKHEGDGDGGILANSATA